MLLSLLSGIFANKKEIQTNTANVKPTSSVYDYKMKALMGTDEISLRKYKGKKFVLLNVASARGYTPQYADWQKFHEQYGDKAVSYTHLDVYKRQINSLINSS